MSVIPRSAQTKPNSSNCRNRSSFIAVVEVVAEAAPWLLVPEEGSVGSPPFGVVDSDDNDGGRCCCLAF